VPAFQVASDIVVEWDFDNDGDFDETVEDITSLVLSAETRSGRDWASQLTGKASPGILRAVLNNADDRFSFFNADSPLNSDGNSLATGRKLRVRTSGAGNPDPALLARDRFNRVDFASGGDVSWTQPLDVFNTTGGDTVAGATDDGEEHIAVTDVAQADYYAQIKIHTAGRATSNVDGNELGLVYRYQDVNNYSRATLRVGTVFSGAGTEASQLQLVDVVAGTPTTIFDVAVEVYDSMTIGVLLSDDAVTLYQEGVEVTTETAIQTDETEVGIYAFWGEGDESRQPRPELDDFYVWDALPSEVEGILWTGHADVILPDVQPGPRKIATLQGIGVLSKAAGPTIRPTRSVLGRETGKLIGNTLAAVELLHPPCQSIDEGDVTTGPVAFRELKALEMLRRIEETEFGFLKESNEGYLCFESRSFRDDLTSQVTISDHEGTQFGYHRIQPKDSRREIINRVIANVSLVITPSIASHGTGLDTASGFSTATDLGFTMPDEVVAGNLIVVAISATTFNSGQEEWLVPPGWRELTGKDRKGEEFGSKIDDSRVYVRVADGSEAGVEFIFGTTTQSVVIGGRGGTGTAQIWIIDDWFGDLSGVHLGPQSLGTSNAPAVLVPWTLEPTFFVAIRFGMHGGNSTGDVGTPEPPNGYTEVDTNVIVDGQEGGVEQAVQTAFKVDVKTVEDPSQWFGTFTGFIQTDSVVLAIRRPEAESEVQLDDVDSQDDHNIIRTHRNASGLFASEADAETYAQLVLDRHADDRPIVSISFYASKSTAYRAQAIRRRVSDRITLQADENAGLGIDQDFFIESIAHRWSQGTQLWETTWELSPAT
jgi:hypothetical protein